MLWANAMRKALVVTAVLAGLALALQMDARVHHQLFPIFAPSAAIGILSAFIVNRVKERRRAEVLRRLGLR